ETTIVIPADKQSLISWAYENAVVDGREDHEDGSVSLDVRLTARQADELDRKLGSGQKAQKEDWER
ncbi:MAG TPA: GTPase HflX, partial [Rhizobium sp.]|nr:GTPase HflX [Rhizobium sp.]